MTGPAFDDYDAVVYDLDGTLVRLAVDWSAVRGDVGDLFDEYGIDYTPTDWTMLDVADEHDLRAAVEAIISEHEIDGAHRSRRLELADELRSLDVAAGVCSLNCERACAIALETHDLATAVQVVVGRDSVPTRKPDPEPLLSVLSSLDVAPERALFVGDSLGDRTTADRAGTDFRAVPGSEAVLE